MQVILLSFRNRRARNDEVEFESVSSYDDGSGSDLSRSPSKHVSSNLSRSSSLSNNSCKEWDDIYFDSSSDHVLGYLNFQYIETCFLTYPIYSIPLQQNETCFLTYHSSSSSFEECANKYGEIDLGKDIYCPTGWGSIIGEKLERKNNDCISLHPFGLATYRFQGDVWLSPSYDNETLYDLFGAAESWLNQINAAHHDYTFFRDSNTL
ncbi:unnamed protein product [Lupinus luteus]|uniref:Uncharacterized protein n=1 Tax=Lupinus luteus TaxID=3873 RepID=A0AAV1XHM2_LUPLU